MDKLNPIYNWLPVREAWVTALKAHEPLTSLVSASRIFGERVDPKETWPFIRVGLPITTPYSATGQRGATHRFSTHVFAKGPFTDSISRMCDGVIQAVNGLTIDTLDIVNQQLVLVQLLPDVEADHYHAVIDFELTAVLSE